MVVGEVEQESKLMTWDCVKKKKKLACQNAKMMQLLK